VLVKLCYDSCQYAGKNYDNRFCGGFHQDTFDDECGGPKSYFSSETNCEAMVLPEDVASQTWKIILVSLLCVIGFLLLVSYGWGRYRNYRQKQVLEKEDDDERQRELEKAQNIGNQDAIAPPSPQYPVVTQNNLVQSDSVPFAHPSDPRRSSVGNSGSNKGGGNRDEWSSGPTLVAMPGSH
jgi:hypothetical protein